MASKRGIGGAAVFQIPPHRPGDDQPRMFRAQVRQDVGGGAEILGADHAVCHAAGEENQFECHFVGVFWPADTIPPRIFSPGDRDSDSRAEPAAGEKDDRCHPCHHQ